MSQRLLIAALIAAAPSTGCGGCFRGTCICSVPTPVR